MDIKIESIAPIGKEWIEVLNEDESSVSFIKRLYKDFERLGFQIYVQKIEEMNYKIYLKK